MPADDEKGDVKAAAPTNKLPLIAVIAVLIVAVVAVGGMFMVKSDPQIEETKIAMEYMVPSKMYQLKDGAYLKLAFSIVVDEDKIPVVQEIVEKKSPGRLPSGVTMILGNKSREDLISGRSQRESFAKELKKMLEERVFGEYNRKQTSSRDTVEIREVLISDFVTQAG